MRFIETGKFSQLLKEIYLIGDLVSINLAYFLSFFFRFGLSINISSLIVHFILLAITNVGWIIIGIGLRVYNIKEAANRQAVFFKLLNAIFFLFLLISATVFLFHINTISRIVVSFFLTSSLIFLSIWRIIFLKYIKDKVNNEIYNRYVIIGAGSLGFQIYKAFDRQPSLGYKFVGYFDNENTCWRRDLPYLGKVNEFYEYAKNNPLDEIFVAMNDVDTDFIKDLVSYSENNLIKIKIVPDFRKYINRSVGIEFLDNVPIISLRKEPLSRLTNRLVKRIFDVCFSSLVIIGLLSWLIPLIGILIKFNSPGPIFFRQERNGENNKIFKCIKFRSMKVNKLANDRQASKDDPRITKFGKFLRQSNLDELPQFYNVFMGDMSIVGPRPHMLKHTEEYSQLIDKYMLRQSIKPGITGWAQVSGFRGETKDPELMRMRVLHDVWYMENWTFMLDLKIILLTVVNMVKGEENAG
jgi:putative colanic acid biosysnthesis UDP-glucose lipid carrier transferase